MSHIHQRQYVKAVLVGNEAVGKTSILVEFANECCPQGKVFVPRGDFDFCERDMRHGSTDVIFGLYDTSSSEYDERRRIKTYEEADIIIIVFSFDDPVSLLNVKPVWFTEIQDHSPGTTTVLLGNKHDRISQDNPWEVSDLAENIAQELKINAYRESRTVSVEGSLPPKFELTKVFEKVLELAIDPDPYYYYDKFEYGKCGYLFQLLFFSCLSPLIPPWFVWSQSWNWIQGGVRPDMLTEIITPLLLEVPVCVCYPVIFLLTCFGGLIYVCFFGDFDDGGWCWGKTVTKRNLKHSRCTIL